MHRSFVFAAVAGLALCFAAATPASAATSEPAAQRVSYADLRLDSDAGARTMLVRIRHAARNVCGARTGIAPLALRSRTQRCVREAEARAVADVGHPKLTTMYYRRTAEILG